MIISLPCIERVDKSRKLSCGQWQQREWCKLLKKYVYENDCTKCKDRKEQESVKTRN